MKKNSIQILIVLLCCCLMFSSCTQKTKHIAMSKSKYLIAGSNQDTGGTKFMSILGSGKLQDTTYCRDGYDVSNTWIGEKNYYYVSERSDDRFKISKETGEIDRKSVQNLPVGGTNFIYEKDGTLVYSINKAASDDKKMKGYVNDIVYRRRGDSKEHRVEVPGFAEFARIVQGKLYVISTDSITTKKGNDTNVIDVYRINMNRHKVETMNRIESNENGYSGIFERGSTEVIGTTIYIVRDESHFSDDVPNVAHVYMYDTTSNTVKKSIELPENYLPKYIAKHNDQLYVYGNSDDEFIRVYSKNLEYIESKKLPVPEKIKKSWTALEKQEINVLKGSIIRSYNGKLYLLDHYVISDYLFNKGSIVVAQIRMYNLETGKLEEITTLKNNRYFESLTFEVLDTDVIKE